MECIKEPVRQSVLDVVRKNLKITNRTTYITRFMYFGEYFGTIEIIQERMQNIIEDLNSDYEDVCVTGILLVYLKYYIHVLEASEDVIFKHFTLIYNNKNRAIFGKAIPLSIYHHVYRRFFSTWYSVFTTPPVLLATLQTSTLPVIQKHVSNCVMKIYSLCVYIADTFSLKQTLNYTSEELANYLPESGVLHFLLNATGSSILETIEEYIQFCSGAPYLTFYGDSIWPPPCDFMPYNVLSKYVHRTHGPPSSLTQQQQQQHKDRGEVVHHKGNIHHKRHK